MIGSAAALLYQEQGPVVLFARQRVPHLRLVVMPEATAEYIGAVYTKAPPLGRLPHPQDRPLLDLWRVTNMDVTGNGVYAVRVTGTPDAQTVFLSETQKHQRELPSREEQAYGRDEVNLEPHPISRDSALWNLLERTYRKDCPNTAFQFV